MMDERSYLETVMLEAMKPWRFGTMTSGRTMREFNVDHEKLKRALDAAAAAGFEIRRAKP